MAIFTSVSVFAQPEKGHVYLKNGTILKGKYHYNSDKTKLQLNSAGNLWVFDVADVDSIISNKDRKFRSVKTETQEINWFVKTEFGVLAGNSGNSQGAPFSITSSFNYKIKRKISVGAGLGVEFLKESYMPVFARFEYKIRDSYSSPYIFLKAGYQIPLEESNEIYNDQYYYQPWSSSIWPGPQYQQEPMKAKGGFLINPGLGYLRMYSQKFGMSFGIGYQFHRLKYTGENDYGLDIDYNRLTIKLGIIFN